MAAAEGSPEDGEGIPQGEPPVTPKCHQRYNGQGHLVHQGVYVDRDNGQARWFFAELIDKDAALYEIRIKDQTLGKPIETLTVSGFAAVGEYLNDHALNV